MCVKGWVQIFCVFSCFGVGWSHLRVWVLLVFCGAKNWRAQVVWAPGATTFPIRQFYRWRDAVARTRDPCAPVCIIGPSNSLVLFWADQFYASLAQLVEHALRKRMVVGSIPTGGSCQLAAYILTPCWNFSPSAGEIHVLSCLLVAQQNKMLEGFWF